MIYAATLIPIVDATAISLTDGLFTVLLAIAILGERVSILHWLCAGLCAAGALIIILGVGNTVSLTINIGVASALAGAVLVSFESILIKTLSSKESPLSVLLYVNIFGVILLSLPSFYYWHPLTIGQTLGFILLGPIAITAQYCWIKAFQNGDAAIVAPINYSWVVFAAVLGIFWFGESLSVSTIVGAALICLGGAGLAKAKPLRNQG